jgi:hypothetical protein
VEVVVIAMHRASRIFSRIHLWKAARQWPIGAHPKKKEGQKIWEPEVPRSFNDL